MEPTISEIFDVKEGCMIYSSEFFKRGEHEIMHWRRVLEEAILTGKPRLICPYCKQMVKLCGRWSSRGQVSYFSHLYDSDDCEIKTTTQLTKEEIEARKYGQIQESERHQRLKKLIAEALSGSTSIAKGISDVQVEKRINSKLPYLNWRRPDVVARFRDMNIVFELQLSTTFLSVVVDRDIFYRLNGYFIIWVFNFDDNKEYVNLYNLMCKDIYYGNKRNIFIFDQKAQEMSSEAGELYLRCQWLDANGKFTEGEYLTIDQLSFDNDSCKPFYVDADKIYYANHPEIQEKIAKLEKSRYDFIDALIERQRQEQARIKAEYDRLERIKDEITTTGNRADIYELDGKFGFEYKSEKLTNAIYSDISWNENSHTFALKKGARIGIASPNSSIIVPCNCTRIEKIDDNVYLIVSKKIWQILGSSSSLVKESPHDSLNIEKLKNGCLIIKITHPAGRSRNFYITKSFLMFLNHETIKINSFSEDGHEKNVWSDYEDDDPTESHDILSCGDSCFIVNDGDKYDLFNAFGLRILSEKNEIQYIGSNTFIVQDREIQCIGIEPDAFILQDRDGASLFDAKGHLLFSKKFCNFEPGFPGELKVVSASNHNIISIVNFSGIVIPGDKYGFRYAQEKIIRSFSNDINMIETEGLYWLRSSDGIDLTDHYESLEHLPNGFFLGDNEDIISPDATMITHTYQKLKYFNEYIFLYDSGWRNNHIGILNMHGESMGHKFSNVYLKDHFIFTDFIKEIGYGCSSEKITVHGLYTYDGKCILESHHNDIRIISDDLIAYSYKNKNTLKCLSNGQTISVFSINEIHRIANFDGYVYYKIRRDRHYTLVDNFLDRYGNFNDVFYDKDSNIIKGTDKEGKVYNALTKELIFTPKIPGMGDIIEGKITGIKPYGIFVNLDSIHSGLLHVSNIINQKKSISDFKKGQPLKVRITKIVAKDKFNLDLVEEQQ